MSQCDWLALRTRLLNECQQWACQPNQWYSGSVSSRIVSMCIFLEPEKQRRV